VIKNEQVAAVRGSVVNVVPEISGVEVWVRGGGTAPSSLLRGDATRYDRLAANFRCCRLHRRDRQLPTIYLDAGKRFVAMTYPNYRERRRVSIYGIPVIAQPQSRR
jgi:hypothetical protein